MRLPILYCCLFFLLGASSCIILGNVKSDYRRLTAEQKARISTTTFPIDSLSYDENIYVVNTQQIKEFFAAHDSTLLYNWFGACVGINYLPWLERYCQEHSLALCVFMRTFYWPTMPPKGVITTPILFVDPRPYNTKSSIRQNRLMYMDLTGFDYETVKQLQLKSNFIIFHRDRFDRSIDNPHWALE